MKLQELSDIEKEKLQLGNSGGYEEIISYLNINIINKELLKELNESKTHKQYINILHKIRIYIYINNHLFFYIYIYSYLLIFINLS